jgi:hypothetical protein
VKWNAWHTKSLSVRETRCFRFWKMRFYANVPFRAAIENSSEESRLIGVDEIMSMK